MASDLLIANLLRLAGSDLGDARSLSSRGSRNAIYHCEQAAEKVILAVLSSENKHGGVAHRLQEMVDLIPDENPLKPLLRAIEELASYATTYRYPSSSGNVKPSPSPAEFDRYAGDVEAALTAAVKAFGVDLSKPNTRSSRPEPHRIP